MLQLFNIYILLKCTSSNPSKNYTQSYDKKNYCRKNVSLQYERSPTKRNSWKDLYNLRLNKKKKKIKEVHAMGEFKWLSNQESTESN